MLTNNKLTLTLSLGLEQTGDNEGLGTGTRHGHIGQWPTQPGLLDTASTYSSHSQIHFTGPYILIISTKMGPYTFASL